MLRKIVKTIEEFKLFTPGQVVVVAVSGGVDSVVLLDILLSLKAYRLSLVVAHLDHQLRGVESDRDASFVADLACRLSLPLEIKSIDVRKLSREKKISLEEAGRVARRDFLDSIATRYGAERIALAHHADDQAETLLLRLLRGAGTTGLAAMQPISGGRLVRPLLYISRCDIEAYAAARHLDFRVDSSNSDTTFFRNRIRHELVPLLESYNPGISGRLATTADILAADEEILCSHVSSVFAEMATCGSACVSFMVPALSGQLRGMRLRLYREAIRKLKGDLARIAHQHLEDIDGLVHAREPNLALDLPDAVRVVRCYDALRFCIGEGDEVVAPYELTIPGPGIYLLPGGAEVKVALAFPPVVLHGAEKRMAWFDLAEVPFPWLVRTFRNGDRFVPSGMTGHKKLKDFFVDEKIPPAIRRSVPLLFSGNELIWICGMRTGSRGRVTQGTSAAVNIVFDGLKGL